MCWFFLVQLVSSTRKTKQLLEADGSWKESEKANTENCIEAVGGETNQRCRKRKSPKWWVLLWSSPVPLGPFSALHHLNNRWLDLLFHLRQEQVWQVLHLNLLICTAQLPTICQVLSASSREVWSCPSLFNIFHVSYWYINIGTSIFQQQR